MARCRVCGGAMHELAAGCGAGGARGSRGAKRGEAMVENTRPETCERCPAQSEYTCSGCRRRYCAGCWGKHGGCE